MDKSGFDGRDAAPEVSHVPAAARGAPVEDSSGIAVGGAHRWPPPKDDEEGPAAKEEAGGSRALPPPYTAGRCRSAAATDAGRRELPIGAGRSLKAIADPLRC